MPGRKLSCKERMFQALTGGKPDVVPAAPVYMGLFLADFQRGYYVEQYRRRLRGRSRLAIDHDEDTLFRVQAVAQSYGVLKDRPDRLEVGPGASRAWAERTEIVVQDGVLCYEDRGSGLRVPMDAIPLPRRDEPLRPTYIHNQDLWDASHEIRDEEDVAARLPILTAQQLLARGDFDLPRQVAADYGDAYFVTTTLGTPFSYAYDLLGFQGLMVVQVDRPALLHYILRRQLAEAQETMAAWAATGIHGVFVEEVFTGADLISPRAYDEFVFAYNQPYFHTLRELGLLSIHYVCGDVIPRLDRMVELEIEAVAVEEGKKNFQIELDEVVDRVAGRAAVCGNIDAVRFGLQAGLDEMAAEVKRQARIGARAKGFVVSTGSPFPLDTNPRLIDTLVATAHSLEA
jgi:uroporphyrinogen-III decarboxylase